VRINLKKALCDTPGLPLLVYDVISSLAASSTPVEVLSDAISGDCLESNLTIGSRVAPKFQGKGCRVNKERGKRASKGISRRANVGVGDDGDGGANAP
jgi:hypothetical protein